MRYFVKIVREFPTAGHLVFWKPYPWVKIHMLNASAENLSTTTRNLYLESLGISEQTLNTLVKLWWGFVDNFCGFSSRVDSVCQNLNIFYRCQKHSLYAHARQSLLLLTQGNIYNRLRFLKKYLVFLAELNQLFRENWSKFLTAGYNWVPGCRVSVSFPVSSHQYAILQLWMVYGCTAPGKLSDYMLFVCNQTISVIVFPRVSDLALISVFPL